MTRFKLDVGRATDIGRKRDRNEDYCATHVSGSGTTSPMRGLLLVADGMGGERGGAEASRLAVEQVLEELHSESNRFHTDYATHQELTETVRRVIRETSDRIFQAGAEDESIRGLGSTLVLAAFRGQEAWIAHVGDSRCYLVRAGEIRCLTCDHTWVAGQVEAGTLTARQARLHPGKGVLTRTLGDAVSPGVDVRVEAVEDQDLFILCSDGVTNALSDSEIFDVSKRFVRPQDLAEALVALASDKDGSDNATVVVCRCHDAARLEAEPEDTEPIYRPEVRTARSSLRRIWLVAGLVGLLAAAVFLPRFFAAQAFDRGKMYAEEHRYLHARQEFETAIRLGLDKRRAKELVDILRNFPSSRPPAEPPPDEDP